MTLQTTHPSLDALVEEIAEFRPLPPIAAQVLQIAEGETFSAHELAQAISSDPALTARVLRVANSAYFGFPRRIITVRDAVVLLGFRQVRATALAACALSALPTGGTIDPRPLWQHAITVGLVAELLARSTRRHVEEAFTAGVLHNIGRLALDQARPAEFRAALTLARREGLPLHQAQAALLGYTDAEVGGALALRWAFPEELALAIAHHARPISILSDQDSLAAMVVRARDFTAGQGITDGVEPPPLEVPRSCAHTAATVTPVMEHGGGFDALLTRAASFIEHTAVGV